LKILLLQHLGMWEMQKSPPPEIAMPPVGGILWEKMIFSRSLSRDGKGAG